MVSSGIAVCIGKHAVCATTPAMLRNIALPCSLSAKISHCEGRPAQGELLLKQIFCVPWLHTPRTVRPASDVTI